MNYIYHEKQEGSLCAQHCLNNLLQGNFFTAVELAEIAQKMDTEEMEYMSELGTHTEDFQRFLQQPSSNMDDSGMFSIQVLSAALKVWSLSLVPYASTAPLAVAARKSAIDQQAYICNFREHWFTVRKLGHQWFNLNSLLIYPELISDTYLALFLSQLQHENYSIFVVDGTLPPCQADDALKLNPAVQTIKPQLLSEVSAEAKSREEDELRAALSASLEKVGAEKGCEAGTSTHQDMLQAAISLSLQQEGDSEDNSDDVEKAIRLSLEASQVSTEKKSPPQWTSFSSTSQEDKDLERALQMSLDESLCTVQVPESGFEDDTDKSEKKHL